MANKVFTASTSISKAATTTGNDSTDLTTNTRWISFTNSGTQTLTVIFEGDSSSVTLTGLPTGLYPFAVRRVLTTGTTVTNIAVYY